MLKEERKVRKDKKIDIKPTIPTSIKSGLYQLSSITNQPVKSIGEYICMEGISSNEIIELLSQYFRRDYWHRSTLILGDLDRSSLQKVKLSASNERITIKFTNEFNEELKALAFSMDITPSKAAAILIDVTIKHTNFISDYIKKHVTSNLNYSRVIELREMLVFINKHCPYTLSWGAFISYLYGKSRGDKTVVSQEVYDWIKQYE